VEIGATDWEWLRGLHATLRDDQVVTQQQEPKRTFSAALRLPFISLKYEAELRAEAKRLRDEFTAAKRDELFATIREGAGNADTLWAQAELQYFLTMFQVNSAEQGSWQVAVGTWILALGTIGLVAATVVLAVITAHH
jgi:hypothetical protein